MGQVTVQQTLSEALGTIAGIGAAIRPVATGRTDAGVHALGQVAHFDIPSTLERSSRQWRNGLNGLLPDEIKISWVKPAKPGFHARHSATSRSYLYLICNRHCSSTLLRQRSQWVRHPLSLSKMRQAAQSLLGCHDFSAFRSANCGAASPIRTLYRCDIEQKGDWLFIHLVANAFLQRMVRRIVGSLVEVGKSKQSPEWIDEVLQGKGQVKGGDSLGGHGLYMLGPTYPSLFDLPQPANPSLLMNDIVSSPGYVNGQVEGQDEDPEESQDEANGVAA